MPQSVLEKNLLRGGRGYVLQNTELTIETKVVFLHFINAYPYQMKKLLFAFIFSLLTSYSVFAQGESRSQIKVYSKEIFDVLHNPGIGFTTFQCFNDAERKVFGCSHRRCAERGWEIPAC